MSRGPRLAAQPLTAREGPGFAHAAPGVVGCVLALMAGVAAGTGRGSSAVGSVLGLAICGFVIAAYLRDPVQALIGLWIVVVFNSALSMLAGYDAWAGQMVRRADELLLMLLVVLTAWRAIRTRTRIPLRFLLPGLCIAVFGLLGALVHHVPLTIATSGGWLALKLWVMIGVTLLLPWQVDDLKRVYRVVTSVGVLVAVLGLAEFATHGAVTRALHLQGIPTTAANFRPNAVHSVFYHPAEYSVFMSILFAFTFARFSRTRNRSDLALATLFAISVVMSLRLKGAISLGAVVVIVALAQSAVRARRSATVTLAGLLVVLGVYILEGGIISKQVTFYTSSETSARAQLYRTSVRIGADDMPLGVGFGRFASYPSVLHYSPVYDEYGLSSVDGLSRLHTYYVDDVSWPSVLGEAGYAGLLAYVLGLVAVAVALARRFRTVPEAVRWAPLAALCALGVILVDSAGAPTLFDWVPAVSFALIFGPAMTVRVRND